MGTFDKIWIEFNKYEISKNIFKKMWLMFFIVEKTLKKDLKWFENDIFMHTFIMQDAFRL